MLLASLLADRLPVRDEEEKEGRKETQEGGAEEGEGEGRR